MTIRKMLMKYVIIAPKAKYPIFALPKKLAYASKTEAQPLCRLESFQFLRMAMQYQTLCFLWDLKRLKQALFRVPCLFARLSL